MRTRCAGGLALIVVIGVLGVMAILAMAFVTMAQLERRASLQRSHAAKAQLLARSGIEDALARLEMGQDPAYGGEDLDGDGVWDAGSERTEQAWRPDRLDAEGCPAQHALRPSFFVRDGTGFGAPPSLVGVEGRLRGCSGRLQGDLTAAGNHFSLQVEDESGKINVNGGLLDTLDRDGDAVPDHRDADVRLTTAPSDTGIGWNYALTRILDALDTDRDGNPDDYDFGKRVIAGRPPRGYDSLDQLRALAGGPADADRYLTVSSWVDRGVIHPREKPAGLLSPLSQPGPLDSLNELKRYRGIQRLEEGGRPPVNLNAANWTVLRALTWFTQGTNYTHYGSPRRGSMSRPDGESFTSELIARRAASPFSTWGEFAAFCDARGFGLLAATFDPNTRLNKQLPDQLLWRWVDKSDLPGRATQDRVGCLSTEGSLLPTGHFRVTGVGRILSGTGRLLAQARVRQTVQAFSLARQTSQKDFVSGRAALDGYLSKATGTPLTTGASASWNTWGAGQGLAVMTYPCAPTALPAQAADFDGYIGLATVETRPLNPFMGVLRFLHHFDDGWDADFAAAGGDTARQAGPSDSGLQADCAVSVWPDDSLEPSTLVPDGAHLQWGHCPAFKGAGNFPPTAGTGDHVVLSYWVKPVWRPEPLGPPLMDLSFFRWGGGLTHAFCLGRRDYLTGICLENSVSNGDNGRELQVMATDDPALATMQPGLRWQLVTVHLDTAETDAANQLKLDIRSVLGTAASIPSGTYGSPMDTAMIETLCTDGSLLVLGGQMGINSPSMEDSNCIMDEFALYDFGDSGSWAISMMDILARQRFRDGRYYKENDGAFLSAEIAPEGGLPVRLLKAWWTAFLPRETRRESISVLPYVRDRLVDPTLLDAAVEVELLPAGSTLATSALDALGQGGRIGRVLPRFQYRVRFRPTPAWTATDRLNQPVLETPFFDDITFAYQPATGPRVLSCAVGFP